MVVQRTLRITKARPGPPYTPNRAIRVGELLATETPRFLETSGESAAQHETTRQNKQRIIF